MRFYLGTSEASWLWDKRMVDVPLFVSAIRLRRKKNLKPALTDWALDSGGFSALSVDGEWPNTPEQYADEVRRYAKEIGRLQWAASMDWMCEDVVRELTNAKDSFDRYGSEDELVEIYREGTSINELDARGDYRRARIEHIVEEHQRRSVDNYLRLCELAPEINWVPTIQGWGDDADDEESTVWSYSQHVEMYYEAGVLLHELDTVGVGSVCRRQNEEVGAAIIKALYSSYGLTNLHGFGFKVGGLTTVGHILKSADSLAWSYAARKRKIQLPGCKHKYCNVCQVWSKQWRAEMLEKVEATEFEPCYLPTTPGPYQPCDDDWMLDADLAGAADDADLDQFCEAGAAWLADMDLVDGPADEPAASSEQLSFDFKAQAQAPLQLHVEPGTAWLVSLAVRLLWWLVVPAQARPPPSGLDQEANH